MKIIKGKIAKAQKICVYGPEGIGKSTLAAQFPDPLFIDTEGSTNNMDVARLENPSSLTMLLQEIEFVKRERPCKTLVIDTADWTERLVIQYVCDNAQKSSITQFGYGEGYIQLEEKFGKLLNLLSDLVEIGINVVITAHSNLKKFEQPDEMGAYDRYELKLGNKTTAKTSSLLKEWADMVLFCNYKTYVVATDDKGKKFKGQGGKRVIYTTHHPAWDAKNRFGLPDEMDMDFSSIAHLFENIPPTTVQQPKETIAPAQSQPVPDAPLPDFMKVEDVPEEETLFNKSNKQEQSRLSEEKDMSKIPKSLRDLMLENRVDEWDIQMVVGAKGYYPEDTPIENYDSDFITGVLVGAWTQVYGMIKEMKSKQEIPFK